jgi:hypothetical protein
MTPIKPIRRWLSRRTLLATSFTLLIGVALAFWGLFGNSPGNGNALAAPSAFRLEDIPFDGARAYTYLKQLCDLGPRPSGSAGMARQQELLAEHFTKLGGRVEFQRFRIRHPRSGAAVPMANMLVHWGRPTAQRILLCAHYDTLPFPLLDRQNRQGRFVGANDNASGVALLMELAHRMSDLPAPCGVDFLLLDGEEFIFDEQDRYFLGSEYFARDYVANKPDYRYRWAILLDMIGDADLQLYQERNSLWWKDTRPLVEQVWATAARLGVSEFVAKPKHEVRDDHLMLHDVGHIPAIDIIDFDYPAWHTQADTPEQCSPLSLAKVGWVIFEWLNSAEREP